MAELKQLPDVVDLSFVAGDTFRIRVRVIDPDTAAALPLEGNYTFAAAIATETIRYPPAATFEAIPDEPEQSVILLLDAEATAGLIEDGATEFKGIWDLEVSFPDGDVRTVAKGSVTCVIDITNTAGSP